MTYWYIRVFVLFHVQAQYSGLAEFYTRGDKNDETLRREAEAEAKKASLALQFKKDKKRVNFIDNSIDQNEEHNVWNQKHAHSAVYMKTLLETPELLSKLKPDMPREAVETTLRSLYRLLTTQLSDFTPRQLSLTYNKAKFYYRNIDIYPLGKLRDEYEGLLINTMDILIKARVEKVEKFQDPQEQIYDILDILQGYRMLLFMIDELPTLDNDAALDQLWPFFESLYSQSYGDLVLYYAKNYIN